MVTALRSGPPPIPPAQPNRAAEAARLPDFARGLMSAGGGAGPAQMEGSSPEPTSTAAASRPQTEGDASRPVRAPRPGSLLDIRV